MSVMEKQILVFKVIEESESCEKVEFEAPVHEILKSDSIYIIVDPYHKEIWIWNGKNANIRLKFIATQQAPSIRDTYGIDFKISAVDEGYEDDDFKDLIEI